VTGPDLRRVRSALSVVRCQLQLLRPVFSVILRVCDFFERFTGGADVP